MDRVHNTQRQAILPQFYGDPSSILDCHVLMSNFHSSDGRDHVGTTKRLAILKEREQTMNLFIRPPLQSYVRILLILRLIDRCDRFNLLDLVFSNVIT
mmetsp:Transcript_6158/g.21772  ORF Transcript_6158/g.21772 Transcript_6158/m.21772 type:complete len:98 (-) Transcript_6158:1140-1433(-)